MKQPIPDCYWVVPEQLLAGEYPGAPRESDARAKVAAILDAGVRSFVDLTETEEGLIPYSSVMNAIARERGLDVRYRRMAIRDYGIPTAVHMRDVLDHVNNEIAAGRPVYAHCWGGIGRTGTIVGCWMVEKEHQTGEDALQRIAEFRRGTPDARRTSPETQEQRDFITQWPP